MRRFFGVDPEAPFGKYRAVVRRLGEAKRRGDDISFAGQPFHLGSNPLPVGRDRSPAPRALLDDATLVLQQEG